MRYLHTMVRVLDLDKAIHFFELLGLREVRRKDSEKGRFTLVFMAAPGDDSAIELTHNWDQAEPYELGSAFGHLAVAVPDVYEVCSALESEGVSVPRTPGPMKFGGGQTHMAFIEDPDGYRIELIQRA